MSINARCTLFFTDAKYGWSETYWLQAEDLRAAIASAATMGKKRYALCGGGPTLPYIRASDDAVLRDSLVSTTGFNNDRAEVAEDGGQFIAGAVTKLNDALKASPADQPYSAILVRMNGTSLYRRLMYLRGAPDEIIVNPAGPLQPVAWSNAFKAWAKHLVDNRFGFMVLDKSPDTNPPKAITNIVVNAPLPATVTIPGHAFADLSRVRVYGCKGFFVPKGVYTVKVLDNNTVNLLTYAPASVGYLGGGKAVAQKRVFQAITEVLIRGETRRATGRPFDSPRGRRRAARA